MVPPLAEIDAAYAPPAVPLARLVVVILRAVGWPGGFPEDAGGVRVTLPHPVAKRAVARSTSTSGFCFTAAPCDSRKPSGGDSADEQPIGGRDLQAVRAGNDASTAVVRREFEARGFDNERGN